jgi:hypothetical protein
MSDSAYMNDPKKPFPDFDRIKLEKFINTY